jgi:hypothetical protein
MILLKDGLQINEKKNNYVNNKYPIKTYSKIKIITVILQFTCTYTPYYQTLTTGSGTKNVCAFIQSILLCEVHKLHYVKTQNAYKNDKLFQGQTSVRVAHLLN